MLYFFDKIALNLYSFSKNFINSFSTGKSKNELSKIQVVFFISLLQTFNFVFSFLDYLLTFFFCYTLPKIIMYGLISLILIFNYFRYFINSTLENLSEDNNLFFKNVIITCLIIVLYIALSYYLMFVTGDFVRNYDGCWWNNILGLASSSLALQRVIKWKRNCSANVLDFAAV